MRAIREVTTASLGVTLLVAALVISPVLGYEKPSLRLPGDGKGRTEFRECPEHGKTGRRKRDGSYTCSKCGRSLKPPTKR
jgi:hypothetical protein